MGVCGKTLSFVLLVQLIIHVSCKELPNPNIVIIGAGAAGIAAASRLLENNFTNFKILEAEGRIGGRIYSVPFGDAVADLGAEWLHGETIYDLVKDLDLLELADFSKIFYHSSGEYIDQNFTKDLLNIFYKIFHEPIEDPEGVTLGDYLSRKYNQEVTEIYGSNQTKLDFALKFLDIPMKETLIAKGAFSWFDLSAKSDFVGSPTIRDLNWKGRGFITFLDFLLKTYPNRIKPAPFKHKIFVNKEVRQMTWDYRVTKGGENDQIPVRCLDGTVYHTDHVILTTSLGVLKDRYNTLFSPPLPQEKIDAIKELGIAAVSKVFFHFPQRWWPDKFKSIALFWDEKDTIEFSKGDQSWLLDFVGMYTVARNPNVLEAWFAGESVPKIETFSDEKIIDGIMFTLNKFLGHEFQNITKPESLLRFNWYSNPYFRGTYSYQTVSSRKREVSAETILSKPLISSKGKQAVLFAGEATSPNHYASVHGAVETGFREADRIINIYK